MIYGSGCDLADLRGGLAAGDAQRVLHPVERHNDAIAAIELAGIRPSWKRIAALAGWMPSGLVNLGLDLRGGAHLLAEVQVQDVYANRMEAMWPEVRDALRPACHSVRSPATVRPDELRVRIGEPENMAEALEIVRGLARPVQTLTGVGANDIDVRAEGDIIIVTLSDAEKTVHG